MITTKERVRFAPSPTGWLHLGSVRAALFNKLYALKNNGTFILRIEDTDQARNVDPDAIKIQEDLAWLNILHDEGPYFQSKRSDTYNRYLDKFIELGLVYRCFDTPEELEQRREEQIKRGLPPKYDRACLQLTSKDVDEKIAQKKPFIWRIKLPAETIKIHELTRGWMEFDLTNFSDFALTRQDGTFTFLFANFVDDLEMGITTIIRGEDHLSNSASQAALYHLLKKPIPKFFHLPLVCSAEGKKLSKRDFGFALHDLKNAGFLPQAICNYVAILGYSLEQEILSIEELAKQISFNEKSPKSSVRYDEKKLLWINHQWIQQLPQSEVISQTHPFLAKAYGTEKLISHNLEELFKIIQPSMNTLTDAVELLRFIFESPKTFETIQLEKDKSAQLIKLLTKLSHCPNPDAIFEIIKSDCPKEDKKKLFALLRTALTGKSQGIGIKDLLTMLSTEVIKKRISYFITTLKAVH